MKRKVLMIIGIVLGVLVLAIILIWPAAPLWARLGAKPMCIQGSLPKIKFVSCPQTTTVRVEITPFPTLTGQAPIPVIVDDDGSPDGVIALLYFLSNPLYDVRAVTISSGEAHPDPFAPQIIKLLTELISPSVRVEPPLWKVTMLSPTRGGKPATVSGSLPYLRRPLLLSHTRLLSSSWKRFPIQPHL